MSTTNQWILLVVLLRKVLHGTGGTASSVLPPHGRGGGTPRWMIYSSNMHGEIGNGGWILVLYQQKLEKLEDCCPEVLNPGFLLTKDCFWTTFDGECNRVPL